MTPLKLLADVDQADRWGWFTLPQWGLVGIVLAVAAGIGAALWAVLPSPAVLAVPLALAAGGVAAVANPYRGQATERLITPALRHLSAPRTLVNAPEGIQAFPKGLRAYRDRRRVGELSVPWQGLDSGGRIVLGKARSVVLSVAGIDFALRSAAEQRVLASRYEALLNACDGALQVVVAADPVRFDERIRRLVADGFPSAGLNRLAEAHAIALKGMEGLRRQVYLVVTGASGELADARSALVLEHLEGMGLAAHRLPPTAVRDLVARASDGPLEVRAFPAEMR